MKIATILPTSHLHLEDASSYHLCLAHQVKKDPTYAAFFKMQAARGNFVIQDNGVVETGESLPIDILIGLARTIGCDEMILPDCIGNPIQTIHKSFHALNAVKGLGIRTMVVPQGSTASEWANCAREMLTWNVDTIGISKFVVPSLFPSRVDAIYSVPKLITSDKDIHMLGFPGDPVEIQELCRRFGDRIRGIDSGIAAIYTQVGRRMNDNEARPKMTIDLDAILNEPMLLRNMKIWKVMIGGEYED